MIKFLKYDFEKIVKNTENQINWVGKMVTSNRCPTNSKKKNYYINL